VKRFAALYARLDATTSTLAKVDALRDYFAEASDEDAAWAVFFLAGEKPRQAVPTKTLRGLTLQAAGIPDWLFEECYQAVGDLAETIAHLLPSPGEGSDASLSHWVVQRLLPLRSLRGAELEAAVLAESGASLEDFARARLDGTRRAVRVFLADLAIEAHPLGLRVAFRLPKGSYATVVMREFTKRGGSAGAELTELDEE